MPRSWSQRDVRVAAQEPQELADHRMEVHLLRGHEREPVAQVEPHLVAEHAQRAGARPVVLSGSLVEHPLEEIEVLPHTSDGTNQVRRGTKLLAEPTQRYEAARAACWVSSRASRRSQGRCGGEADAFRGVPGRRPGSPAADSAPAESAFRDKVRTGRRCCPPRRCRSRRQPATCRDRASSACRRRGRRSSRRRCRAADPAP